MREHEDEWADLMRRGNAGDSGAYHRLLKAITPFLRAVTRQRLARAGQPVDQSEDIVQEILLAVHLKRHTWDADAPFSPWLFAIARNKLVDALRRRGRRIFVNIEDFTETIVSEPVAETVPATDVTAHLQGLPRRQRDVLLSIAVESISIRATAAKLAMSEGAVRVALHRGLANLAATAEGVRMDTDHLLQGLATDNDHRERPVGSVLATALMIAAPVSLVMFFTTLGFRKDIATALHDPFFDLKFLVTTTVVISATAISIHLSRPEASLKGWKRLLLIPVGLLSFGIVSEMMMPQRLPWTTRLIGSNSKVCMTAIPLLSLPLLIASLVALRHGAPTRPALAGACAGLLSAGFAATLYALQCTDDSPLFVATWYPLAIGLVTAVGALAGSRWLRF